MSVVEIYLVLVLYYIKKNNKKKILVKISIYTIPN